MYLDISSKFMGSARNVFNKVIKKKHGAIYYSLMLLFANRICWLQLSATGHGVFSWSSSDPSAFVPAASLPPMYSLPASF